MRWVAVFALLCAVSCQAPPASVSTAPKASCCESASPAAAAEGAAQPAAMSSAASTTILPATVPPAVTESQPPVKKAPAYSRAFYPYEIPNLTLVDQDGQRVNLTSELESSDPVALNFVFTTCTTICPVMTATFSQLRRVLGDEDPLRLVTISLDPEYDSPKILRGFSRRYGAGPHWKFLTGDARTLMQTYRAFNAVTGSKFNHRPFTLFKVPGEKRWLRIDGMASVADLAAEYRSLMQRDQSPAGPHAGG